MKNVQYLNMKLKLIVPQLLLLIAVPNVLCQTKCPVLNCDDKDGILAARGSCFLVQADNNGKIAQIRMGQCDQGSTCYMYTYDEYVWVDTYLQFYNLTNANQQNFSLSQFYGKLAETSCMPTADTFYTRMNSGRNCNDGFTCNSRNCDSGSNNCMGYLVGSSCADHMDCDQDLACRMAAVWPYETTCQPRGETQSACRDDYDCKMRNFCWQVDNQSSPVCIEMYNAPYGTQFFWDSVQFPVVNRAAILFHGKYCQSGFAMQVGPSVAECVNIYNISQTRDPPGTNLTSPYPCTPDGNNRCQYHMIDGTVAFSLICECAMIVDPVSGNDLGYCPLPDQTLMMAYIDAIKLVWYQDNCHTLDRENFIAQINCGVGDYNPLLQTALDLRFQVKNYPWVQDPEMLQCISRVLPDSSFTIFS